MKAVQDALYNIGIPVFALAWKATESAPTAPDRYIVYTTMTVEDEHWDDELRQYRVYVYLNLWSKSDPTADTLSVRSAMRAGGFQLVEETDFFEEDTGYYRISSTWVILMKGENVS